MKPQENTSAEEAARLQRIKSETARYLEAMKAAQADGVDVADYIDPAGMDALRRITALAESESQPAKNRVIPTVTEIDERGQMRGYDLFSLLVKQRIVLLEGQVDDTMASIACATLLYLNSAASGEPGKEIRIHINSPGGSVLAGLAIYDTMRSIEAPVKTVGLGMQASMGSILLAAGDKRVMTKSSWLMIHQISSGANGQHSDTAISESLSARLHEQLKEIYVRHIGLTHEFWDLALERNTWLTAEQAKKMGFIHTIINTDRKATPYEKESIREEFQKARDSQVPKTAAGIIELLNNASARGGEAAKIRPELVTALSQFPRFWTEAKKKEEAAKKEAANDNQDTPVSTAKKKPGASGPQ